MPDPRSTDARPRPPAVALAALTLLSPSLCAQDALPEPGSLEESARRWVIQAEPALWYVAPGGRLRLSGASGRSDTVRLDELNLDSPRASPLLELHAAADDWRLTLGWFHFSTKDRGTTMDSPRDLGDFQVGVGERLDAALAFSDFRAIASVPVYTWSLPSSDGDRDAFRLSTEVGGGLRFIDLDIDLTRQPTIQGPLGTSADGFFAQPVMRLALIMDFHDAFTIDVAGTAGYFNDGSGRRSISWDIIVGFAYRPTPNLGFQVGYRQLAFDLEDTATLEPFQYRGALAGLYFGAYFRF